MELYTTVNHWLVGKFKYWKKKGWIDKQKLWHIAMYELRIWGFSGKQGEKTLKFIQETAATHVWVDSMHNFFGYSNLNLLWKEDCS